MARKKWKRNNPEAVKAMKQKYYDKSTGSKYSYYRWDDWENKKIKDPAYSDTALHKLLGRSVRSIQVQRSKLRKQGHIIPYKGTPKKDGE